jgi:hypothetical protein
MRGDDGGVCTEEIGVDGRSQGVRAPTAGGRDCLTPRAQRSLFDGRSWQAGAALKVAAVWRSAVGQAGASYRSVVAEGRGTELPQAALRGALAAVLDSGFAARKRAGGAARDGAILVLSSARSRPCG